MGGKDRGTQEENSYTKHTVTNRIPVTTVFGRVNETSHWNVLTKYCELRCTAKRFFRRK